ncbi:MAG: hypothetical protein SGI72_05425 [Planctomycetota bacterium]|nr:hypothetical protein [Planctomycetota bacterium]
MLKHIAISTALALSSLHVCARVADPANPPARVQQADGSTPEVFEKVDPYTKGKSDAFDKAGYVSLGPFAFAEGIPTADIEEVLGGLRVLWVETAHFKLGSLLQTYRRGTDDPEEKKLNEELSRLSKKLPRVRKDVRELDPWLRLHLYAQRIEDEYADYMALVGVSDADFARKPGAASAEPTGIGSGPYLGNELKFTVLLTEKRTQLDRFARRWIGSGEATWHGTTLPGKAWFLGLSAESISGSGVPHDCALHAFVVTGLAYELCDGFRGSRQPRPQWFRDGLALYMGRRVEPRWSVFVPRESAGPEDESWHFEERVHGLVTNRFVPSFSEMFLLVDNGKLEARHYMTAWSRVSWLLDLDRAAFRKFHRELSEPWDPEKPGSNPAGSLVERQQTILESAFGKKVPELDEAWRKFVLRKYPKK